jgi:hypothetical protein
LKKCFMARLAMLTTQLESRDNIFVRFSCLGYLQGEDKDGK